MLTLSDLLSWHHNISKHNLLPSSKVLARLHAECSLDMQWYGTQVKLALCQLATSTDKDKNIDIARTAIQVQYVLLQLLACSALPWRSCMLPWTQPSSRGAEHENLILRVAQLFIYTVCSRTASPGPQTGRNGWLVDFPKYGTNSLFRMGVGLALG